MERIPDIGEPKWYAESNFCDSHFVEVKSNEFFEVHMQYPVLGMKHAERQCFVRQEVYDMLKKAAQYLPDGYKIKIWDAWRPFALQVELYDVYSAKLIDDFGLENCTQEQKNAIIGKFVSAPIEDQAVPPVHTTGGAVDVTIIDQNGIELEMGTVFDAFTDMTNTAYFEHTNNETIRDHRRMLYHAMIRAGFTNLPSEWWHFDYGDRFWGFYNKRQAIYRGVFTRAEINNG